MNKVRIALEFAGVVLPVAKDEQWADLIHEYEMARGIFASKEQREASQRMQKMRLLVSLVRAKNSTEDKADPKLCGEAMKTIAGELGMEYQPDLLDAG